MSKHNASTRVAQCQCREVLMDLEGEPIMTVACYCKSCQKAAGQIQILSGAPAMLDDDGGTHFVIQRKDRLHCRKGKNRLRECRLTPDAPTRRVVAGCCNTPMFLEFTAGHWLSVYKDRLEPVERPPLEMRTMTQDKLAGVVFNDDIPSPKKHTVGFMWKLIRAWIVMGFKTPKIDYVKGDLHG